MARGAPVLPGGPYGWGKDQPEVVCEPVVVAARFPLHDELALPDLDPLERVD